MCLHVSVKYAEVLFAGGDTFATKEVVRDVQAAAAEDGATLDTAVGVASLDSEGLYWVEYLSSRVIWVPAKAESLKKRLLVCSHLEGPDTPGSMQRWLGFSGTAYAMAWLVMYGT